MRMIDDLLRRFFAPRATSVRSARPAVAGSDELLAVARLDPAAATCAGHGPEGLTPAEAAARRATFGPNVIAREGRQGVLAEIVSCARSPLNALLLALAVISSVIGDIRAAVVIAVMVVLAVVTAFVQEHRSSKAAAQLRALVKTNASVRRRWEDAGEAFREIPLEDVVPGDIVRIAAGDMMPGDLRLIEAKDLFVNQAALTGEAMPAEKFAHAVDDTSGDALGLPNICFMGANVVSGFGVGMVVHTGADTFFGQLAEEIAGRRAPTAFDHGIDRFTVMMVRFLAVMAPAVFLINGLTKHDWLEALLFAVAVAVGLTPEMLPMIVTVNLAKGAIAMARKKVVVKRLQAIQNFGAMDVLCTDKTGTLTQDRIVLKKTLDLHGEESERVLQYAYINSHFQSGLKNLLDVAVLDHAELHHELGLDRDFTLIDEIPFDFARRRLSVVVNKTGEGHILICKGAVEEIFEACTHYEIDGVALPLDSSHFDAAKRETADLNSDGFRVVAVAYKTLDEAQKSYAPADECDLVLLGFIAFLDPPKESAGLAISALAARGVRVMILTGDNDIVTRKVCRDVGIDAGEIALGAEIEKLDNAALELLVERATVFAKLAPAQKERVVAALHRRGHVVGFMGDGINDSPALKAADVGISVDTAVDIAKESADIILLEKNLMVLQEGVIEGRRTFANIVKYIRMGASSNFGNMFSVLGASMFLPFLPMAPIQVLTNNLLYDFSQTTIPTDNVDDEYLATPRKWDIGNIFKFMVCIGPISSIFDYATFALMLYAFDCWANPALFQTGWFIESLLTQTLIIHVIRTVKIPFVQSRASAALIATSLVIAAVGILLPVTPAGAALGFVSLPWAYWPAIAGFLAAYAVLAHLAKVWFARRFGM
jgi:P-type Mg2+ transporter